MSEKGASKDKSTETTSPPEKDAKSEESAEPTTTETTSKLVEEKPPEKEKPKRKVKKRLKLTVLQAAVLETIRERPQRPRAIQTIIRGVGGVDVPRNDIIRSLTELKEKGLVEKVTTKAWQAK